MRQFAAGAGADDAARACAQATGAEFEAGLGNGLARGHQRELADAIEQDQALFVEVPQRIEIAHLGGIAGAQTFARHRLQRRDRAATGGERLPCGRSIRAERCDRTLAGDDDAAHGRLSRCWAVAWRLVRRAACAPCRPGP